MNNNFMEKQRKLHEFASRRNTKEIHRKAKEVSDRIIYGKARDVKKENRMNDFELILQTLVDRANRALDLSDTHRANYSQQEMVEALEEGLLDIIHIAEVHINVGDGDNG